MTKRQAASGNRILPNFDSPVKLEELGQMTRQVPVVLSHSSSSYYYLHRVLSFQWSVYQHFSIMPDGNWHPGYVASGHSDMGQPLGAEGRFYQLKMLKHFQYLWQRYLCCGILPQRNFLQLWSSKTAVARLENTKMAILITDIRSHFSIWQVWLNIFCFLAIALLSFSYLCDQLLLCSFHCMKGCCCQDCQSHLLWSCFIMFSG